MLRAEIKKVGRQYKARLLWANGVEFAMTRGYRKEMDLVNNLERFLTDPDGTLQVRRADGEVSVFAHKYGPPAALVSGTKVLPASRN